MNGEEQGAVAAGETALRAEVRRLVRAEPGLTVAELAERLASFVQVRERRASDASRIAPA